MGDKNKGNGEAGWKAGSRTERPHAEDGWSSHREAEKFIDPADMPPRGQAPGTNAK